MLRAALVAALAAPLAAGAAFGQSEQAYDPSVIAAQKAKMLKGFLVSERLESARQAHPDAVGDLEAQAMLTFELGERALERGEADEAMVRFDEGIRLISQAVAMASKTRTRDENALAREYESRRRNAEMYLASIEAIDSVDEANMAFSEQLREELKRSEQLYSNGEIEAAGEALDASYHEIVQLVGRATRGGSLFVERIFETPQDEFEYELERNKNYELLIGIALEEQAEAKSGLVQLANGLKAKSGELREQAMAEAESGDAKAAIKTIERSTELFIVVLRSAGLVLTE